MRLTSLHLHTENVRLDDLSPGLNVAYAPSADKRRLIPSAVRGALFPACEEGHVARVGIQSSWGGFQLVTGEDDHDFQAIDSQGQDRGEWLREQMAGTLSESSFAAICTPRLGDPLALDAAMREVCGDEFARSQRERLESLLRELDEARPWQGREAEVTALRAREIELVTKLQHTPVPSSTLRRGSRHRAELTERISRCQRRLARLESRTALLTQRIERLNADRVEHAERRKLEPAHEQLAKRVTRIESRLEELRVRGESVRHRMAEQRRETHCQHEIEHYDQLLGLLNREARRLESHVVTLAAQPEGRSWSVAVNRLIPRLKLLNEKLDLLCSGLSDRRSWIDQRNSVRTSLDREFAEIQRVRQSLSDRLAELLARKERTLARLEAHPLNADPTAEHRALARRKETLDRRAARGRARLRHLEHLLANRKTSCPAAMNHSEDRVELEAELLATRQRLGELEQCERNQSSELLGKLKSYVHDRPTPAVLIEASRIVRQLSDGEFIAIHPGNAGREAIVEQPHGKTVTCDLLSRAERVHVHLALCLAAAADMARRGLTLPLILNDVTRYYAPARLRTVIELLRSYCRASGQVVLLTSQQHVATLCRSLGAASYWLARPQPVADGPLSSVPGPQPVEPTASRATHHAIGIGKDNWDCEEFPGELSDRKRLRRFESTHAHPHTHAPVHSQLKNQRGIVAEAEPVRPVIETRPSAPPSVRPATSVPPPASRPARRFPTDHEDDGDSYPDERLRVTGHYLELCDRITEISFLSGRTTRQLEAAGVYTVANFLHAEPVRLLERLAAPSIDLAELKNWQAQSRLMCAVRRLRGYDAKILVACGITTAEQLADIRPDELYDMVEAFVATPEGSRVVRSGNEHEIKRITRWIRSVQHAKRSRGSAPDRSSGRRSPRARNGKASRPVARERRPSPPRAQGPVPKETPVVLALKFHLEPSSHVEAAPSIGPSMAKRLEVIGVVTVANLLAGDCKQIAQRLAQRRVTDQTVREWQQQALLVCRIPELRGHDAQILVACGVTTPEQLAAYSPTELHGLVTPFVQSKVGKRVLRSGTEPSREEVGHWIAWARQARQFEAA